MQSALIGQLTQCIVIGRTPQAHVGLWNQLSVINLISSSPRGEQSHVTDTVMMIVCVCKQATIKTISDGLYTPLWCDQSRCSLYAEYASCVRPPKHQGPLALKGEFILVSFWIWPAAMKAWMIIYCNAVLSPFLRKNQSNHVTWML